MRGRRVFDPRPPVVRWVRRDWPALVVVGVASVVAGFGWNWTTRPMGDSASYRSAARAIAGGWHHLTDRTPGYPVLLWLTGSTEGETHLLFVVHLVLHVVAVLLMVDAAARIGVPARGRAVIALLLVAPPEMVLVVSAGSEALAQFLVVVAFWACLRWYEQRRLRPLVLAGVALGLLGWVTPAMALLALPVGLVVALLARRSNRVGASAAALVGPVVILIGSLFIVNVVRFDAPELTPLTGWYLGSRTSLYVERLPLSYEPARSILVRERNRQLLEADRVDAPNYSFAARRRIERALELSSREADRYMLRLNIRLIVTHPFEYLAAVNQSVARYVDVDSEPGVLVLGRPSGWAMALVHLVLAAVFGAVAAVMAGLAWVRRFRGATAGAWALGVGFAVYGLLSATALETGTVRLRVPFDPILVLLLVSGCYVAVAARRASTEPASG